jgi:hypothetical protein
VIKMLNFQGRSAPLLVCDVCAQPIRDAGLAAAVFPRSDVEGEIFSVLHVHKGACHDRAEADLDGAAGAPWQELRHHLVYLLGNVGLDDESLAEAIVSADTLGRIS